MSLLDSVRPLLAPLAIAAFPGTILLAPWGAATQQVPSPPGQSGPTHATTPPQAPGTTAAGSGGIGIFAPGDQPGAFAVLIDNGVMEFGAAIKKLKDTTPDGVISETGSGSPGDPNAGGDPGGGDPGDDGTGPGGSGGPPPPLPAVGDPHAIKAPLLSFRDLASGGGFYVGGDDFWQLELVDLETGVHEVVRSTQFDVWSKPRIEEGPGWVEIILDWKFLTTPRLGLGPFHVEFEIRIEENSQTTDMQLRAVPMPLVVPRQGPVEWSFFEGAVCLPIHQDVSDPTVDHFLLSPLGLLVEDPANSIDVFDCFARPVSQVFGFYNSNGLGLYGASLDVTGKRLKNFRFEGTPGSNWVQTKTITYHPNVQTGTTFESLPVRFGLFEGDWWDLGFKYRKFIQATAVASKGPVANRGDVPNWLKSNRALGVFATGAPFTLADGQTLPDHLGDWLTNWGLAPDDAVVVQFGTGWIEGGNAGIGPYPVEPTYLPYLDGFETLGVRMGIYLADVLYNTAAPEYPTGWADATVLDVDGEPLTRPYGPGGQLTMAYICPSTQAWLTMVHDLASAMANDHGVDLFYVDNFFPVVQEACFAVDHGHPPGMGAYLTDGFAETFRQMIQGGNGGGPGISPARFSGYSEGHNEAYVPTLGVLGPAQLYTDFVSADDRTRVVPLHALVYHDLALAGPVRADPYFLLPGEGPCPNPPCDPPVVSIWSPDPLDRALARRSAGYVLGWGWANGSALWSPERSFLDPNTPWAHEIPQPMPPELVDGVEATLFAGELGALRGGTIARRYLNVGRRLRDAPLEVRLPLTVTPAPDVVIELVAVPDPAAPGTILGPEQNFVRPIVQGVWADPPNKTRAVALTNFTTDALMADLTLDPAELELDPATVYTLLRWSGGLPVPVGSLGGSDPPLVLTLPIAGESAFLLLLEPL